MSAPARDRLMVAATIGQVVSIIYHRGSQPGSIRQVVPITVSEDEVRAHDVTSGFEKTFKLAYVELAGPETIAPAYNPALVLNDTRTLLVALEPHLADLRALGWHLETAEGSVSVHRYFQNGKPRKSADVLIMFTEFAIDAWDDGIGAREEGVKSTRPYYVSSPSFERARTFTHLSPAIGVFLHEARKHAPRSTLS